MISLKIPGVPPSTNHAYMNNGFGGRTLSKAGQLYKRETTTHLVRFYPREMKFFVKNHPYLVYARFYFEALENKGYPKTTSNRFKELDATNRTKLFEDALKDATAIDDSHNMVVVVEKRQGSPQYTEVFVWDLEKETTPIDELFRLRLESVQPHRAVPAVPAGRPTRTPVVSERTSRRPLGDR